MLKNFASNFTDR